MFVKVSRFSDCTVYTDQNEDRRFERARLRDIEFCIDRKEKIFSFVTYIDTAKYGGKKCLWIDIDSKNVAMVVTDESNIVGVMR